MISQKEDHTGRKPQKKTAPQNDNLTDNNLARKQPCRKTILQEDNLTGRLPQRKIDLKRS